MPLFWKPYTSDTTSLIEQLKANKPRLAEQQRQGRNLLWDRPPIDLNVQTEYQEDRVPQQPYVYQTKS
jgi:hypothetical protein